MRHCCLLFQGLVSCVKPGLFCLSFLSVSVTSPHVIFTDLFTTRNTESELYDQTLHVIAHILHLMQHRDRVYSYFHELVSQPMACAGTHTNCRYELYQEIVLAHSHAACTHARRLQACCERSERLYSLTLTRPALTPGACRHAVSALRDCTCLLSRGLHSREAPAGMLSALCEEACGQHADTCFKVLFEILVDA
jgi:hypothetical protein